MIGNIIASAVAVGILSLVMSAIGKAKGNYREKHPGSNDRFFKLNADLTARTLDRSQIVAMLRAEPSRNVIEHLAVQAGMTATWCKNRVELETFLADKYSTKG